MEKIISNIIKILSQKSSFEENKKTELDNLESGIYNPLKEKVKNTKQEYKPHISTSAFNNKFDYMMHLKDIVFGK